AKTDALHLPLLDRELRLQLRGGIDYLQLQYHWLLIFIDRDFGTAFVIFLRAATRKKGANFMFAAFYVTDIQTLYPAAIQGVGLFVGIEFARNQLIVDLQFD